MSFFCWHVIRAWFVKSVSWFQPFLVKACGLWTGLGHAPRSGGVAWWRLWAFTFIHLTSWFDWSSFRWEPWASGRGTDADSCHWSWRNIWLQVYFFWGGELGGLSRRWLVLIAHYILESNRILFDPIWISGCHGMRFSDSFVGHLFLGVIFPSPNHNDYPGCSHPQRYITMVFSSIFHFSYINKHFHQHYYKHFHRYSPILHILPDRSF